MPEQSDESAVQKIREISQELARRKGLPDEEAEEICGHLEDKLTAYLQGEIRITQEDAFLLARAHFGDARGIALQLSGQDHAPRPELRRHRTIVKTAIATSAATMIALPCFMLIFSEPAGNFRDLLAPAMILLGIVALLESGVFLAATTDLKSRWQRTVAAIFILPAVAALYVSIAAGLNAFMSRYHLPTAGGYAAIVFVELTCLLGHAVLLLLLLVPVPEELNREELKPAVARLGSSG